VFEVGRSQKFDPQAAEWVIGANQHRSKRREDGLLAGRDGEGFCFVLIEIKRSCCFVSLKINRWD
jgi:hypothetical protein